jgi:hypothetical protein
MSVMSATAVQKTFKLESTTLFGEATYSSAGTGSFQVITAGGASKGIASITKQGTGLYTIVLDSGIPVKKWLGSPSFCFVDVAGSLHITAVNVLTRTLSSAGVPASLGVEFLDKNGNLDDPDPADILLLTLHYTSSPVF